MSPEKHGAPAPTRREFLAAAAGTAATFTIVPGHVLGMNGAVAANSRVNLAFVGVGSQGFRVMFDFLKHPDVQPVAVCDPVKSSASYHQWGASEFARRVHQLLGVESGWEWLSPNNPKLPLTPTFAAPAGVAGREPAQKIVDAFNGKNRKSGESRGCVSYADYRELFAKEKDFDAVVVGTTDVHHAPASIAAMRAGKHVYCQKPMAHSIPAARLMTQVARETGVVTQVAVTPAGSDDACKLAEWIDAGAIGKVERVENWTNRPSWPQGVPRPAGTAPIPDGFDWDLWLGPASERPYHPDYLHFVWRGWHDFGCGAFGDMGCYSLDVIYRALKLSPPVAAEGSSSERFPETFPKSSVVHLDFDRRGSSPPVRLTWYDGGLRPSRPDVIRDEAKLPGEGMIFHGSEGTLVCDFNGGKTRLLPDSRRQAFQEPAKTLPRSPGNEREWLDAIQDRTRGTSASFDVESRVTEALHLGNIAVRTGERVRWDTATGTLQGSDAAKALVHPAYRKGWNV